jgi:hypothetical protein
VLGGFEQVGNGDVQTTDHRCKVVDWLQADDRNG